MFALSQQEHDTNHQKRKILNKQPTQKMSQRKASYLQTASETSKMCNISEKISIYPSSGMAQ
jgi:hypothetical protein